MADQLSRKDRIIALKVIDNVGQTDGVDLSALSEEDFNRLEEQVVDYASTRADAWNKAFESKKLSVE
jgi:hypothetical protein